MQTTCSLPAKAWRMLQPSVHGTFQVLKKWTLFLAFAMMINIQDACAVSRQYMEQKCQRLMRENPPKVSVTYNYGELRYDFSKNRGELEKIFQAISPEKEKIGEINGVTLLNPKVETSSEMNLEELSAEYACLFPKEVVLRIMFDNPVIYILKNLPEDTCLYKQTLRHEQTHADIGHSALYLFAKAANKQLKGKVVEKGSRIVTAENVEQTVQEMNKSYQDDVSVLFNIFVKVLKKEQAELDSPENYAKESALCR